MNNKKAKSIRKQTDVLLVEWLKSLLNKEEAHIITLDNYKEFMPDQTHIFVSNNMRLSAYHPKWMSKKIKQLIKIFPELEIKDITLEMVQWKMAKSQA